MNPQLPNDELLIKASFGGNAEAFGRLVRKYQSFICAITFSATGSIEKSEELAQEVFVLAWQNLAQLKNYTKFKSWLYAITKNQIKKFYRTQKRDPIARAAALQNTTPVKDTARRPLEAAISKEQQAFVRDALDRIPANYREPLVLFYREGKSVRQVADFFELSEDAAKKRLSRARQMLRSQLANTLEQTLTATGPRENFSVGVVGLIAAGGSLGKTAAAAGTVKTAGNLITTWVHSITAKITAAAAVVIVGASTTLYVASQHESTPSEPPVRMLPLGMDKGLVLHLSFDNIEEFNNQVIVTDESRFGNHGSLTGGKFVEGRIGKALKCRAKNKADGIIVKDNDSLDLDAVTIAAWVKTKQIDAQWGRILDKGWQTAYNLCIGGDWKGESWYRDRAELECAGKSTTSNTPILDGKWHLIAGTYDGQILQIYIDGKLDVEKKLKQPQIPGKSQWDEAGPMKYNDADIHIGSLAVHEDPPYDKAFFDGLIDEVRLYNRILSLEEIQILYRYQPY